MIPVIYVLIIKYGRQRFLNHLFGKNDRKVVLYNLNFLPPL